MKGLKIRKATIKDLDVLNHIQTALLDDERGKYTMALPSEKKIDTMRGSRAKELLQSKDAVVMLAELDGQFVGGVYGEIQHVEDDVGWAKYTKKGYIGWGFVEPAYRKQGVAYELVQEVLRWFKLRNIKLMAVSIMHNNKAVQGLMKKFGFKEYIVDFRAVMNP